MNIVNYINKEFWCSFKNNNRTLFDRTLWIMGASKYKNTVIINDITEDITIFYANNTRQLRAFNGNQMPISEESLAILNLDDLMLYIEEYYILKNKLYNIGKKLINTIKNDDFEGFKKLFRKFIIIHAKIFSYEYLISSLAQALYDRLDNLALEKYGYWKNNGQISSQYYLEEVFKYIIKYFNISINSSVLKLYSSVDEILNLINNKLNINTLLKRIDKRRNVFVLCNLHDKKYYNKVITDENIVKSIKCRLESLENSYIISQNEVKGTSTYEDKLIITGECVVVNNSDFEDDIFNKIVVCSITTPNDVYKYLDCKALIVDHGGILSHAAIFSREYNKPCLMGTEVGTKVFKTGNIIEIDFTKATAYKK